MIEFIPYILIILGFGPDQSGEVMLERAQVLFASEDECKEAGTRIVEKKTEAAAKDGTRFEYRCMVAPRPEEYDRAFRKATGRGE